MKTITEKEFEDGVRKFLSKSQFRVKWSEKCVVCGKQTERLMYDKKDYCTWHWFSKLNEILFGD